MKYRKRKVKEKENDIRNRFQED